MDGARGILLHPPLDGLRSSLLHRQELVREGSRGRSQRLRLERSGLRRVYLHEVRGCERSVKIKLKIKKTYFENKSNTILKIKDLAAKIK